MGSPPLKSIHRPADAGGDFSLVDEYAEAFQLLHMLRAGPVPMDRERLANEVRMLIGDVRKRALAAGIEVTSADDAGYAICAAIDEAVLASVCDFRKSWESAPLQLALYGDQLAGEHFFDRLERLRERGRSQLPAIEVFHMCLTLGFRGRYHLDDEDKLRYLMARVADEISQARQGSTGLAPNWARPDAPAFRLRRIVSAFAVGGLLAGIGITCWLALHAGLRREALGAVSGQDDIVQLPAQVARVSITLP